MNVSLREITADPLRELRLSVVPERRAGFVPTGEWDDGEPVVVRPLAQRTN